MPLPSDGDRMPTIHRKSTIILISFIPHTIAVFSREGCEPAAKTEIFQGFVYNRFPHVTSARTDRAKLGVIGDFDWGPLGTQTSPAAASAAAAAWAEIAR